MPHHLPVDIPSSMQERITCSMAAAVRFEVPANSVLAVADMEGGRPGLWKRNANGSHDVGAMQFNTSYLRELRQYGITAEHVAAAGCYAFDLAAWRLRMHIRQDRGDLWTRVANYHSRTPHLNARFRGALIKKARKWAAWLEAHFVTVELPSNVHDASRHGVASPMSKEVRHASIR